MLPDSPLLPSLAITLADRRNNTITCSKTRVRGQNGGMQRNEMPRRKKSLAAPNKATLPVEVRGRGQRPNRAFSPRWGPPPATDLLTDAVLKSTRSVGLPFCCYACTRQARRRCIRDGEGQGLHHHSIDQPEQDCEEVEIQHWVGHMPGAVAAHFEQLW